MTGDLKAEDAISSLVEVTLLGEYPFLQNYIQTSVTADINNGGGMSVPMAVPLDLSHGRTTALNITNNGNYQAFPTVIFTGVLTNPSLTITSNGVAQSFSVSQTLSDATQTITVDCYNRTVLLLPSGNVGRQYFSGTFWTIPPGTSTIQLTTGSGGDTGNALVLFADTFLNL